MKRSVKVCLGLLAVTSIVNSAVAADLVTEGKLSAVEADLQVSADSVDADDLESGRIDSVQMAEAEVLADKLAEAVRQKFIQDSTNSVELVIRIEEKLPAVRALIEKDANRAYSALLAMAETFDLITKIDVLDQEMLITSANIDAINEIRSGLESVILNSDKEDQSAALRVQGRKLSALGLE